MLEWQPPTRSRRRIAGLGVVMLVGAGAFACSPATPSPSARQLSPAISSSVTPQPTVTSTTTAGPPAAPTSIVTGTPRPGDEAAATAFVTRFETLIAQQNFADSWAMLSTQDRAFQGSYESWVAGVKLAIKSSGTAFQVGPASHDWQSWWEPDPDWLPRNYPGDYGRAFVFGVADGSSPQNGGSELMVLPSLSGALEIVVLR